MNDGTISGNTAHHGGGVHVSTGTFDMSRGTIGGNRAIGDGGGLFAATYQHAAILNSRAFEGITLGTDVIFYGNRAGTGAFRPPLNPQITGIRTTASSISTHPLNNWDINFIYGERYNAPDVNLTILQETIRIARERVEANYTPASWERFLTARNAAEAMLFDLNATQAAVSAAESALRTAKSGLRIIIVNPPNFPDVGRNHWARQDIQTAAARGWVTGIADSSVEGGFRFNPSGLLNRAEAATIFARMAGVDTSTANRPATNPFPDVARTHWSSPAVAWAAEVGIVTGRDVDGVAHFFPNDRVQRKEFAVMMERFARLVWDVDTADFTTSPQWGYFTDLNQVFTWARTPLQWANATGIITGLANPPRIAPQGTTNRAEAATMLVRMADRFEP